MKQKCDKILFLNHGKIEIILASLRGFCSFVKQIG